MHAAGVAATGDDTLRTKVTDIVRQKDWPERFDTRIVRNAFTEQWHGSESELMAQRARRRSRAFDAAVSVRRCHGGRSRRR